MSLGVSIREGESQDSLLRRFQKIVQMSGVLREAKAHRHFLSKGETARLKAKKYSGRPKGFGFVEMASVSEGQAAITGLNGKTLKERTLNVNAARPRSDNKGGGFGGGRERRY